MKFTIGFDTGHEAESESVEAPEAPLDNAPVPSLVEVLFLNNSVRLSYFNDSFSLRLGDIVFVEGRYEGCPGRVVKLSTHFKIKLEDYKRVISVADTTVRGHFLQAGAHLITFKRDALSFEKFSSWVIPPQEGIVEYSSGFDDEGFELDDLSSLGASQAVFERGLDYYRENNVRFLSLDGRKGWAVISGTKPYTVEFEYCEGKVFNLFCDCPYMGTCKHEIAVMLLLREMLEIIESRYLDLYDNTDYFAAVFKPTFFRFALDCNPSVNLTLE